MNIKNIIIIILVTILLIGGFFLVNKNNNLSEKYRNEVKLKDALLDSVEYFKVKESSWAAEKKTIQGNLNDILKENEHLSENQKALLNEVKYLNKKWKKEKEVWAAARLQYEILIDSLDRIIVKANNIDTINNIISFFETDSAAHFIYDLDVLGVRPFPSNIIPEIKFNKIDFPNTQTITFNFDKDKRKNYPVSFTVMNTNKYYKVLDLDSYVIPSINKDDVNPTFFKKVFRWVKSNGKYVLVGAAGFGVGYMVSGK